MCSKLGSKRFQNCSPDLWAVSGVPGAPRAAQDRLLSDFVFRFGIPKGLRKRSQNLPKICQKSYPNTPLRNEPQNSQILQFCCSELKMPTCLQYCKLQVETAFRKARPTAELIERTAENSSKNRSKIHLKSHPEAFKNEPQKGRGTNTENY